MNTMETAPRDGSWFLAHLKASYFADGMPEWDFLRFNGEGFVDPDETFYRDGRQFDRWAPLPV